MLRWQTIGVRLAMVALVAVGVATAGVITIALGLYAASLPSIYRESSYWTSSLTYFAVRVGILMTALAVLYALSRILASWDLRLNALGRFGRSSLFVYWIHVELVYGYATWPIRQKLPLWGTAIAFALFSALMYAAILGRDRVVEIWRNRRGRTAPPLPEIGWPRPVR